MQGNFPDKYQCSVGGGHYDADDSGGGGRVADGSAFPTSMEGLTSREHRLSISSPFPFRLEQDDLRKGKARQGAPLWVTSDQPHTESWHVSGQAGLLPVLAHPALNSIP